MQQGATHKRYGHGSRNALASAGFDLDSIGEFTDAVSSNGEASVKIVPFA